MKRRVLATKVRRDLRRRLPQVVSIGVMVMLGVLLFVTSYDSFRNVQASYDRTYVRTHFADMTVTGGDPAGILTAVRNAPGVDRVASRTQADRPMTIGATKLVGRVVGIPPADGGGINIVDLVGGGLPDPARGDQVLVERHTADTFGLSAGQRVQVFDGARWRDVTAAGVARSPEYLWPARNRQDVLGDPHAFAVLFAPESLAQTFAGDATANQVLIEMAPAAMQSDREHVRELVRSAGGLAIEDRGDQASDASLRESLHGLSAMAVGFPALFLTAAAIAQYVMLTRLIHTERPIIGTLLALGARRGAVAGHYMLYGAVIAVVAALVGILGAMAATSGYTMLYASLLGLPDTVIEHRLPTAIIGLGLGLLTGVLAGLAPAVSASRSAPAEAMRGDVVQRIQAGWLTRLSIGWTRLPVAVRMAVRSLTRCRRRTAATMLGGVLALVLILSSAGMLTSVRAMLDVEFRSIQRQDATVLVAPTANNVRAQLQSLPGVAIIEPTTVVRVTVAARGRTYATSLTGLQPATVMHGFRTPDGAVRTLPTEGVLAGVALADTLGVRIGEEITVMAATGSSRQVRLAGLLNEPLGTALYATTATAQAVTNTGPNGLLLAFNGGADRNQIRERVTAITGVLSYADKYAVEKRIDGYLVIFWVFAGAMLALGTALGFTVIYVTMTVNLAERTSELAALRAAGAPVRRLTVAVALENLAAILLAVPIGLVAGVVASWLFLRSFNNDLFNLHLSVGPAALTLAVVAVTAVAALSQLPAARLIKGIDIAAVVRDRAL